MPRRRASPSPWRASSSPCSSTSRPDEESGNYYFYQANTGQVVFCITPKPQIWGTDTDNTSSFLPLCVARMLELYPRLRNLKVRRTWRGMYPMTPDGLPIVGYAARRPRTSSWR
ncbi:MAG: FAD-dependent oxidoreductase [Candidatus Moduliflexus flocculans]|nr:FAD-dependent oxidoreductase [Candidatus Moduliflexus flocculans]